MAVLMIRLAPVWRYFITGAALAVLFGLICRGIGILLHPLTRWKFFTGTLTAAEPDAAQTVLTVSFADSNRMQQTVSFPAEIPDSAELQPGTPVRFAVLRTLYEAGTLPRDASEAGASAGKILLPDACRKLLPRNSSFRRLRQRAAASIQADPSGDNHDPAHDRLPYGSGGTERQYGVIICC